MADKKISDLVQITTYDDTTMVPVSQWDGYNFVNKKMAVGDISNLDNVVINKITASEISGTTITGSDVIATDLSANDITAFHDIYGQNNVVAGVMTYAPLIKGDSVSGTTITSPSIIGKDTNFSGIMYATNVSGVSANISNINVGNVVSSSSVTGPLISGTTISSPNFNGKNEILTGMVYAPTISGITGNLTNLTANNIISNTNIVSPLISGTTISSPNFTGKNLTATGTIYAPTLNGISLNITDGNITNVNSDMVFANSNVTSPLISGSTIVGNDGYIEYLTAPTLLSDNVSGNVSVVSPIVSGTTMVESPLISGTTVSGVNINGSVSVKSVLISGTTVSGININGTTISGSTSVKSPLISGTTINGISISGTTIVSPAISGKFIGNINTSQSIIGNSFTGITGTFNSLSGTTISGTTILSPSISGTNGNFTNLTGGTIYGNVVGSINSGSISGTSASFDTLTGKTITIPNGGKIYSDYGNTLIDVHNGYIRAKSLFTSLQLTSSLLTFPRYEIDGSQSNYLHIRIKDGNTIMSLGESGNTMTKIYNNIEVGNAVSGNKDLQVFGNIAATGSISPFTVSDERFKENVSEITDSLSLIEQLRPVTYNYNDLAKSYNKFLTDDKDYGLIAQEVDDVFPGFVRKMYNDDYLGIDYTKFIPLLIDSIQELSAKNKELTDRISKLENG